MDHFCHVVNVKVTNTSVTKVVNSIVVIELLLKPTALISLRVKTNVETNVSTLVLTLFERYYGFFFWQKIYFHFYIFTQFLL